MNDLASITAFLGRTVDSRTREPALGYIRNGTLEWRTWQEVADAAASLAGELQGAGIGPGDRVAHVSENRYEWIITDLALHLARAVHVPIHVTLSGAQIAEQIRDSGAKLVFVSSAELHAKFAALLPPAIRVVVHDDNEHARQPPAPP